MADPDDHNYRCKECYEIISRRTDKAGVQFSCKCDPESFFLTTKPDKWIHIVNVKSIKE